MNMYCFAYYGGSPLAVFVYDEKSYITYECLAVIESFEEWAEFRSAYCDEYKILSIDVGCKHNEITLVRK